MNLLPDISLAPDIVLVAAAVAAYLARPRVGGQLSKGLRVLLIGLMILGLAHFIETGLFIVFELALEVNEIVHRLIIGLGFIFLIVGFLIMRRAFEA